MAIVGLPLVIPGGDSEQLRLLVVLALAGILLAVDGLGPLLLTAGAASFALALWADRGRRRRSDEPLSEPWSNGLGTDVH